MQSAPPYIPSGRSFRRKHVHFVTNLLIPRDLLIYDRKPPLYWTRNWKRFNSVTQEILQVEDVIAT